MEAHCVNLELKYQNQALKEGQHGQFLKVKSNEAKVKHDIDVIETINIELEHKVAKLLKENETLKRYYKELFDSIKTTRAKNIEHITSLIANNDKFKAQLQEKGFAIAALKNESQSTTNGSKPKPRINNQKSRNWPASKSSCVTTKTVPIAEHSRNSRSFSDSKHFVCSTCQKCVFNANHDSCVTKFLNEVNSRAKVPSHKTTTRYKPVEQISVAKKPERQIPKRHRSSIKKTSVVHEKTMTPRSCLRWKPTGKIFKTVGLRWVPTGKIFTSSTTKVDSEPTNGSNDDITNKYECEQTLDVSAVAFVFVILSLNHFVKIPSGEIKVHIEVLLVLWGNRLPIHDGSLPLSRLRWQSSAFLLVDEMWHSNQGFTMIAWELVMIGWTRLKLRTFLGFWILPLKAI
ncbi:hypothetical protein Tco_0928449 [Tanacetum coccineum]